MAERIICYNRNEKGRCMAYNKAECSETCQARVSTVAQKIEMLECLIAASQSKKEKRGLLRELEDARKAQAAIRAGKFEGWMSCYIQDLHRGEGGGASEGDSSNRAKGMKQLLKDNRPPDVKPNKAQQEEYKEALLKWEEEHGKLEKLGRSSLSGSKVNSYTGIPICFCDSGMGHCRGQRAGSGRMAKDCKTCKYLEK